ncbi:MAG: DUF4214 domain-containing protein [Candidatus Humimicrobiaceae bacterium]
MFKKNKIKVFVTVFIVTLILSFTFPTIALADQSTDVAGFVIRLYQTCLDRSPDPVGLDYWVNNLASGEISGGQAAYGFVFSEESINRNLNNNQFLTLLYKAFFDKPDDIDGYNNWITLLNDGASRESVFLNFVNSAEFANICSRFGIQAGAVTKMNIETVIAAQDKETDKPLESSIVSVKGIQNEGILKYNKWNGLGMGMFSTSDNIWGLSSFFDNQVDTLLANGFTQLRIDIPYWNDTGAVEISKAAVTKAVSKGAQVIWGVSSGAGTITADNWPNFRHAILEAAQWAQDNGVYEFQLGNEEESNIDGTTMTEYQIRTNLKSVATDAQAIFTRGKISYSCEQDSLSAWIEIGKGDIDLLAFNAYMGGTEFNDNWKTAITNAVNAFGPEGTYITEFAPSATSLNSYSTDESIQAAAVNTMIEYIKASGITRALSFCYYDNSLPFGPEGFGVLKTDKTYRLFLK